MTWKLIETKTRGDKTEFVKAFFTKKEIELKNGKKNNYFRLNLMFSNELISNLNFQNFKHCNIYHDEKNSNKIMVMPMEQGKSSFSKNGKKNAKMISFRWNFSEKIPENLFQTRKVKFEKTDNGIILHLDKVL